MTARHSVLPSLALAALFSVTGMPSAGADQCQAVQRTEADWAVRLIRAVRMTIQYCQPCGEKVPSPPTRLKKAGVKPSSVEGSSAVMLNGKEVDLAYTYVQTGPKTFANVAKLVGCSADGVDPYVTLAANCGPAPFPKCGPNGSLENVQDASGCPVYRCGPPRAPTPPPTKK